MKRNWPYSPPDVANYRKIVSSTWKFEALAKAPATPDGVVHLDEMKCGEMRDGDGYDDHYYSASCEGCLRLRGSSPWAQARIAELEARNKVDLAKYPHQCPNCGSPAYVGLFLVDCSRNCKGGMP